MAAGSDLKTILEQDRLSVLELLEMSRKLVLEVRASFHWSEQSLETYETLEHIGGNIGRLIESLEPHYGEGKRIFNRPEAAKLWKTAGGLMRALPPIRAKYAEQLDKRRRQRIMGQTYDELPEITAEEIDAGVERVRMRHAELSALYEGLGWPISSLPDGLVPAAVKVEEPSANGQHAEAKDGASAEQIAAPEGAPAPAPEAAPEEAQ